MSTTVYRIQDKYGNGPYGIVEWEKEHTEENGQPGPFEDGYNKIDPDTKHKHDYEMGYFAFKTIEQLKKWFCFEDRKRAYKESFNVYEVEIPEIQYELGHQITYNKDLTITEKIINIEDD